MKDNYLIHNKTGYKLYKEYAKDMPIIDYHCHLNPKEIYENKPFVNLTKAWIVDGHYGDHYKWRAMRASGVSEEYITGDKDDREKFYKWAETVRRTIGNPLYAWTEMELNKYFNITTPLNEETAPLIYNTANLMLEYLTPRKMIELNNVKIICTTDDPIDSLEYHLLMREDKTLKFKVLPAFRPDKAVNIELSWYNEWVDALEKRVNEKLDSYQDFKKALSNRIDFFNEVGAKVSDHALDEVVFSNYEEYEIEEIYKKRRAGKELTRDEITKYKTAMMIFFGKEYNRVGWVQQYHINAMRNNNERMLKEIGPDTGFDAINDKPYAYELKMLLATLDKTNELPKTILYSLNHNDNEMLLALMGCFQGSKGKLQLGSAWWFNDQKDGIKKQISALSEMGLLSNFVGMLTDSRSFLSYPRHDYFRRILCDYIGELLENEEYPMDLEYVGGIIRDICYNNAKEYFDLIDDED